MRNIRTPHLVTFYGFGFVVALIASYFGGSVPFWGRLLLAFVSSLVVGGLVHLIVVWRTRQTARWLDEQENND